MFDELNNGNEQTYSQEQAAPVETAQEPRQQQDSQKEINMRILRERAEAAERRNQELERMVQMNMSQQQQSNKIQLVDNDDFDINDDDLIEGKHLKKYVKSMQKDLKDARKQFEDYSQTAALAQADMKLKSQFSDFDNVVSKENLEKLAILKPALYRTIYSNNDMYDRGYTAYEMIMNSGIVSDQYKNIDKRLEDNRTKPRSASNVAPQSSDTPLARVGDYDRRVLTEARKDELRRQVAEAKRNR